MRGSHWHVFDEEGGRGGQGGHQAERYEREYGTPRATPRTVDADEAGHTESRPEEGHRHRWVVAVGHQGTGDVEEGEDSQERQTVAERTRHVLRYGAATVGGFALVEVLVAVALAPAAGFSWSEALTSFLATNGLMGASFALSGLLIAWHRPHHPLGWLLVADGLGHATSALTAPLAGLLHDHGAPLSLVRLVVTVFMFSWPWSITLFLPLALLLFPDGRLPGPRWRFLVWVIILTAPLFVVEMVAGSEPVAAGMPLGYGAGIIRGYDDLGWLWTASEIRVMSALLLSVVALLVRYRRAGEIQRRQLLWLLLAGLVVVAAVAPWAFVAGTPVAVLFAI